jgi:hypothetical protein
VPLVAGLAMSMPGQHGPLDMYTYNACLQVCDDINKGKFSYATVTLSKTLFVIANVLIPYIPLRYILLLFYATVVSP